MEIGHSLAIGSGIFWTITYILIIRRGLIDKTYGMPILALCLNISWEFIFSFIHPHIVPQLYINIVWLCFDLVILGQVIYYGDNLLGIKVKKKVFRLLFPLILISCFCGILFLSYELSDAKGMYSAFMQNLVMSVLFVVMLQERKTAKGQSVYIGISKMIGTVFATILFHIRYPGSFLLHFLFLMIFIFDVIYIVMIYIVIRKKGMNPFAIL